MNEDNINLEHVQVDARGRITGKVKNEQSSDYEMLAVEMNQHYGNDQMITVLQYTPAVGELCACCSNNQWYRVIVRSKLSARNGIVAVCYFVDEGFEATFPVSVLRHLSPKYSELAHQVKYIHLHGVQPYTMKISPEDIHVSYGTSNVWDESAVKFMSNMVTASLQVRCSVMDSFSDGSLSVRMFLQTHSGGYSCLNETMVKLGYAVDSSKPEMQSNTLTQAADETALIQQIFRKHHKPHRDNLTDARSTRSDSELCSSSYYPDSGGNITAPEHDHDIDNHGIGVSAISHRRFQQPAKSKSPVAKTLTEMMKQKKHKDTEQQAGANRDADKYREMSRIMNERGDSLLNSVGHSQVGGHSQVVGHSQVGGHSQAGGHSQVNDKVSLKEITPEKCRVRLDSITKLKRSPLGSYMSDSSSIDLPGKGRGAILSHLSGRSPTPSVSPSVPGTCNNSDSDSSHVFSSQVFSATQKSLSTRIRSENARSSCNETSPEQTDRSSRLQSLTEKMKYHMTVDSSDRETMSTSSGKLHRNPSSIIESKGVTVNKVGANSLTGRMSYTSDSCTESDTGGLSRNERRRLAKTSPKSYTPSDSVVRKNTVRNDLMNVNESRQISIMLNDREGDKSGGSSSTGNESSTSNMVAAYIKGEAGFKTMRLPRDGEHSSQNSALSQKNYSPSSLERKMQLTSSHTSHDQTVSGASCDERIVQRIQSPKKAESSASNINSGPESSKMSLFEKKLKGRINENQNGATNVVCVEDGASDVTMETSSKKLGEMIGNRVLKRLQNAAKKSKSDVEVVRFSEKCHDVLVQGYRPPKPIYNVKHAKLADHVQLAFVARKLADLTFSQAFAWPAITRGRHVVAVAPPGSGKTLAYLCPLVSALCDPRVYHQVARNGKGPYLIVLTLTWRHARGVYDEVMKVIGSRRDLKAVVIHGGAQMEQKLACELLNGMEILIATPPCLTRILQAGYIDLRRLCNLVIDDADQTLSTFRSDIGKLLQDYDLVIRNDMKNLSCPRQILCFGAQWNSSLSSFMRCNLIDPILIITSLFEAAIYGQVKQVAHMCQAQERMRTTMGILENIPDDSKHPVIIFASVKKDIVQLYKTLHTQSRSCLMVHQDMDRFEVHRVAEQWPVPLLVCWDEYTAELGILDATTIIHYDLPNSKTKFGNRLGCMRKYFYNFSVKEQSKIRPTAHLLITPNCHKQLKTLTSLLSRVECEKTETFKAFLDGAIEQRDENDSLEMCTQTMAFGMCRDGMRCRLRHKILPEVDCVEDADWLPREGEVRVRLSSVQDASHYFVRILGIKEPGSTEYKDLSVRYTDMLMRLSMWYSNIKNKKRYTPELSGYDRGKLCCYEENELFHRVQIFNVVVSVDDGCEHVKVEVFFVDTGSMKVVPAYKLYELPEEISAHPFQAIEVFVCKIRPVDKDTEWTTQASMFIHDSLKEEELVGNVLLRVGRIMWLDPLLLRRYLPLSNTVSQQFYIHEELVRNGYADRNPDHLKRLYKLCEGKVDIPTALLIKTKQSRLLDTDVLPATRRSHNIHVSSVLTPDLFFIQRSEKLQELECMMDEIGAYIECNDVYNDVSKELKVGSYCLAQYTNYDQRWYRAKVLKVEANQFEVIFADYGDSDTVPIDQVRELPVDKFFDLPLQAIECKLADIVPLDVEWDERCGDVIWDLSHYVNSDLRDLTAVVQGQEAAKFGGMHKLVIQLTTMSNCLNIAEELSWQRLATPVEGSDLEPLFSRPIRSKMKFYPSLLDKVPDLCAALYYETDEPTALKLAEEILSILTRCVTNLTDYSMKSAEKCVICLVRLFGRVWSDDAHQVILDCCVYLIQTDGRLCDLFVEEKIVQSIVRCLEMNSNTVKQQQAAWFIAESCNKSLKLKAHFWKNDKLELLLEVLGSSDDDQVQGMVCRALSSLCTGCESVFGYLMSKSVCTKLQKCLSTASDHQVAEGVLMLIAALTEHDSGCEELKKESLIEAIVNNLSKTHCDKCILYSVQQCDYFASTRRKHKTFLLEHQMVSILTRIIQIDLQQTTKQLCKDLLTSLIVKVPSEPLAGTTLRNQDTLMSSNSGVPPDVKWVQNTFRVVLKVSVSGVQEQADNIVNFTENSVNFRAAVDGVCYTFNYLLFDTIIVQKCTVEVGPHIVAISMKKQKEGKWSRLLHQKVKPAHLSVDYENWVDSSSDSEVCDDEQPFVLKKKQRTRTFKTDGVQIEKSKVTVVENESDTSDSLEAMEDFDDQEDDDCYKL